MATKNARTSKQGRQVKFLLVIDPDINRKAVEIAIRQADYANLTRFLNAQLRHVVTTQAQAQEQTQ